jgi:hypothetical protein
VHYNWEAQPLPYWHYNPQLCNLLTMIQLQTFTLQFQKFFISDSEGNPPPIYPTPAQSPVPLPMKPNKEKYMTALAKINDKLDVLQKSMKPVDEDDGGVEIHDSIASLPLKSIEELEDYEKLLKNDGNLRKLVGSFKYFFFHLSIENLNMYIRNSFQEKFVSERGIRRILKPTTFNEHGGLFLRIPFQRISTGWEEETKG